MTKKYFFHSLLFIIFAIIFFAQPKNILAAEGNLVDIVFVIDDTGSMGKYIKNIQKNLQKFTDQLASSSLDYKIGLILYRDIVNDGESSTRIYYDSEKNFWLNNQQFDAALGKINPYGGGDIVETPIDALGFLSNETSIQWRNNAHRYAILLTDADFKNNNRHNFTDFSALTDNISLQSINTSIITLPSLFPKYQTLSERTHGILADINSNDFSILLSELAENISLTAQKNKKAIYILPGYMGSRLYDKTGDEIWVNSKNLISDIISTLDVGSHSILAQSFDGDSSQVRVDIDQDKYGAINTYQKLIEFLQENFQAEYDIIFYPYHWLGDLNDEALDLNQHINQAGYEEITFVTHSTGGLLASNYIALSRENKLKTHQAIMIAAPLFGTYSSLQPLETGQSGSMSEMLNSQEIYDDLPFGVKFKIVYQYIKSITKNSPTTYQLLPSQEYLNTHPLYHFAKNDPQLRLQNKINKYYEILTKSNNLNSKLLNQNQRSHQFWRNNTIKKSITEVLQEVNTILIGSNNYQAAPTPISVLYQAQLLGNNKIKDIIYSYYGDSTVVAISAQGINSQSNQKRLPYYNFDNLSHGALAEDDQVLELIATKIRNNTTDISSKNNLIKTFSTLTYENSELSSVGESKNDTFLKLNISAAGPINIKIYNHSMEEVASIIDGYEVGFKENQLHYTILESESDSTELIIHAPENKYFIKVFSSEHDFIFENFTLELSQINNWGNKLNSKKYIANAKSANELLIDLELSPNTILSDENHQTNYLNWDLEPKLFFNQLGINKEITLMGEDFASGKVLPQNLTWQSTSPEIASINSAGIVTSHQFGTTTIFATDNADSYKFSQSQINIIDEQALSLDLPNYDLLIGEKQTITPNSFPAILTSEIKYEYDHLAQIIEIDEFGIIQALNSGKIEVKASHEKYNLTTNFSVNVTGRKNHQSILPPPNTPSLAIEKENNQPPTQSTNNLSVNHPNDNQINEITPTIKSPAKTEITSTQKTSNESNQVSNNQQKKLDQITENKIKNYSENINSTEKLPLFNEYDRIKNIFKVIIISSIFLILIIYLSKITS